MRNQIHITSPTSEGIILSGAGTCITEGTPTSRITDIHVCFIHGPNCIVMGSNNTITSGMPNARLADLCACGAICLPPAVKTFTN